MWGFGCGDEVSVTGAGGEGRIWRAPDVRGPMRSPLLSIAAFLWGACMWWLSLLSGVRIVNASSGVGGFAPLLSRLSVRVRVLPGSLNVCVIVVNIEKVNF